MVTMNDIVWPIITAEFHMLSCEDCYSAGQLQDDLEIPYYLPGFNRFAYTEIWARTVMACADVTSEELTEGLVSKTRLTRNTR
jgi:hypothetical protein